MAWENFSDWLNRPILQIEGFTLTAAFIVKLILLPIIVFFVAKMVRKLVNRSLKRVHTLDDSTRTLAGTLVYYVALVLGVVWAFGQLGLSTSDLAVFTGALGLGIGLGFQDAAKNFLSGLIMMFGRMVKPGDVVTVEDTTGRILTIGIYSCEIITTANGTAFLPNASILGSKFINWSHDNEERWVEILVGVHYNSDLELVTKLLLEAGEGLANVNPEANRVVYLRGFGDNSINFSVHLKSTEVMFPNRVLSAYNYRVAELFAKHGVVFPYPQRDLYIHQMPGMQASDTEPVAVS
ncbi:MAG: mechanosensitive ion channel [Fimbriimonadaceae bacterium]|nr:mechanosensitive ion channel [Fimbriimonadaceae bacterium]